jgi:hypothetical protein
MFLALKKMAKRKTHKAHTQASHNIRKREKAHTVEREGMPCRPLELQAKAKTLLILSP